MCNRELELDGVICLEVTAAVVQQVAHDSQTVWTLQEAYFEELDDRDHLADPKRKTLSESFQQLLW